MLALLIPFCFIVLFLIGSFCHGFAPLANERHRGIHCFMTKYQWKTRALQLEAKVSVMRDIRESITKLEHKLDVSFSNQSNKIDRNYESLSLDLKELDKKFDTKIDMQSKSVKDDMKELNVKIDKQSESVKDDMKELNVKIDKQSESVNAKIDKQSESFKNDMKELKKDLNAKIDKESESVKAEIKELNSSIGKIFALLTALCFAFVGKELIPMLLGLIKPA